jgi:hypothetical protein
MNSNRSNYFTNHRVHEGEELKVPARKYLLGILAKVRLLHKIFVAILSGVPRSRLNYVETFSRKRDVPLGINAIMLMVKMN